MHERLRGQNVAGMPAANVGYVMGADEVAAFDRFGPLAQAMFREAPIKILCAPVLYQLELAGLDPLKIDGHIAAVLRSELSIMMRGDRSAHDVALGFRPLVARRKRRA